MMQAGRVVSATAGMLRIFCFAFLAPIPIAFLYEPWDVPLWGWAVPRNALVFFGCFCGSLAIVLPAYMASRRYEEEEMLESEGYLSASLAWLLIPALATSPLLAAGLFHSPLDAYFEAMSGFSTTGFSVLPVAPEQVAPSLNFWRMLLHWLGGIGIIVLSLALLSRLTQGGAPLFQAEATLHASKRLRPKLADMARILFRLYVAVTALLAGALWLAMLQAGLAPKQAAFEALTHTFSAFATGSFSSHSSSVGAFASLAVELTLAGIMVLGCTNFQVLVALGRRDFRKAFADPEWRFSMGCIGLAVAAVVAILLAAGTPAAQAAREGTLHTISIFTTTGLSTADVSAWPVPAALLLLAAMFMGGSAGSAGGALKAFRVLLIAKLVARELKKLLHPRAVIPVRFGGRVIPESVLAGTAAFMFVYMVLWLVGAVLLAALDPGLGAFHAAAASAASIGNVGAAFGPFGPGESLAAMSAGTKAVVAALMWVGRLEILTALLLFHPHSWRR